MTEQQIENAFARYAVSRLCIAWKLRLVVGRGWPDRTVLCPGGRVLFFEFKKPGGRVSAPQRAAIRVLSQLGFTVHVCDELEDAKAKLDTFLGAADA